MNKLMSENKANKIYDLLVSVGGAKEEDRVDFIYQHCTHKDGCSEWRFCGKLGFGGKYRSKWNGVTYYPEDETPEKKEITNTLNEMLKKINTPTPMEVLKEFMWEVQIKCSLGSDPEFFNMMQIWQRGVKAIEAVEGKFKNEMPNTLNENE